MSDTSTGLAENIAGLLCYVLGWITGIIFIVLEQKNTFVKFHAMQSLVTFGALSIIGAVFGWMPVIGGFVAWVCGVVSFILWIILMVKAYQGERFKLPWVGNVAERWAG
jgi:uncharacterized membrane protein